MTATTPFERYTDDDIAALIAEYPLAWVLPVTGNPLSAAVLPLIGEYDASGKLVSLLGHVPRGFPLCRALQEDGRATILFKGPDGYVSPEHAGLRNWGPTWNFAQLRIAATVVIDDVWTEESLDVLTDAMERDRPAPWQPRELGERYDGMARQIVGFRAMVSDVQGRFKLGQDERPEVLQTILSRHPDPQLVKWMRRCNAGRV